MRVLGKKGLKGRDGPRTNQSPGFSKAVALVSPLYSP